jgi:hypothetical protein
MRRPAAVSRLISIILIVFEICLPDWLHGGGWCATSCQDQGRIEKHDLNHDPALAETYLNLIIKLQENRTPALLKATQVSGKLIMRQGPSSSFIYEITRDGETLAVGFLPEDPFLVRGFTKPGPLQTENIGHSDSATIILNVPHTNTEAAAKGRIGLRFYKVQHGSPIESIDPSILKKLTADGNVSLEFDLPAGTLGSEIKKQSSNESR